MTLPHPVPEDLAELIAQRLRAIAEPLRIRLLDRLRDGEASVNELATQVGATQQNVSKHLSVLAGVGILGRRKEGNRVCIASSTRGCSDFASRSAVRCRSSSRSRRARRRRGSLTDTRSE